MQMLIEAQGEGFLSQHNGPLIKNCKGPVYMSWAVPLATWLANWPIPVLYASFDGAPAQPPVAMCRDNFYIKF